MASNYDNGLLTFQRVQAAFYADQGTNGWPEGHVADVFVACMLDADFNARAMGEREADVLFGDADSPEYQDVEFVWHRVGQALNRMF